MKNSLKFYEDLIRLLDREGRVATATLISRSGSGPREPGAAMLIHSRGRAAGTIGGGILEANVLAIAQKVIQSAGPVCYTFSFTDRVAAESGMICGGRVEILVDCLDRTDPSCMQILEKLLQGLRTRQRFWLIQSIAASQGRIQTGLGLIGDNSFDPGTLDISGLDIEALKDRIKTSEPVLINQDHLRYFVQPVRAPDVVYIFGAGHIAEKIVPLCSLTGFQTVILDDRHDFANPERFPKVDTIRVLDSFNNCFKDLEIDRNSHIIIVTRGHVYDKTVLSQALRTGTGYIGMIGSRKKRDAVFRALLKERFSAENLEQVYCPIGLDIGAQTPAEIAVSIVAELIAVRSGQEITGCRKAFPPLH